MLRWLGFLAVVAGAILVSLLSTRTWTGEVSGAVAGLWERPGPPGRRALQLKTSRQEKPGNAEFDRLQMSGLAVVGLYKTSGEVPSTYYCEIEIPVEVAGTIALGDVALIRGKQIFMPNGDQFGYVRYNFRRDGTTWAAGGAGNWKFLLVYGVAGGGPLLLWGIAWGVTLLCGLSRKPRLRD